jgi:hypothetical protein
VRYRVLGFEESGVKILVYLMRLGKAIFRYDEKRKEIYILAGETLSFIILTNGNVEFEDESST